MAQGRNISRTRLSRCVVACALVLAACASPKVKHAKPTFSKAPPPSAVSENTQSFTVYEVKPGDTLSKIAARYQVSAAALASFDSVVLTALKETEQALTAYGAALKRRQALADGQERIHRAFAIVRDGYAAGSSSYLDVLTTEQTLVALDGEAAASDADLIRLQIDLFKALGGGWRMDAHPQEPP